MNSSQHSALALFLIALALLVAGCASGSKPSSVYYGESVDLLRLAPLHERGVKTLGMVYRPYDKIGFRYHGAGVMIAFVKVRLRNDLHEVEAEKLVPKRFVEQRLLTEAKLSPHIEARFSRRRRPVF